MKIVFITPSVSQPRIIKRITALYNAGYKGIVYAYDRGVYNINSLPEYVDVVLLGNQKNGAEYSSKMVTMYKDTARIIKKEGRDNVLYYSFGYINSLFLMLHGVKYVYEMSDVLYGYKKFNLVRPFLKILDKLAVKRSKVTLMTSEGFYEYLFGKQIKKNVVLQPNKLNQYFEGKPREYRQVPEVKNLKFAFIGAIRYPDTILRFAKIIGKYYTNHEFHFFGDSHVAKAFQEATSQYKNVIFHGEFKNPTDLENIYLSIDIVVCCYQSKSLNERIAEPNKLYEAAFFGKPIIVSKNTFLATQVEKRGCGWAIDAYSDDSIRDFIDNLSIDEYNRIVDAEMKLPSSFLIDNSDELIKKLSAIR